MGMGVIVQNQEKREWRLENCCAVQGSEVSSLQESAKVFISMNLFSEKLGNNLPTLDI